MLCVYFGYSAPGPRQQDHVDLIYKRIHFQSNIQPRELAICLVICRYADIPQPSQRIFSLSTFPILKAIISLQIVFTVSTTDTKGHILESCIVYFCNLEESHISQDQERNIDACGMVVHSGLYIPVSSGKHPSLLDLVIIFPVLALSHTHES